MTTDRQPWIAALLTFLLPGLGHLYAGVPKQAAVAFCIPWVAGILAIAAVFWAPQPVNALLVWTIALGTALGIAMHAWRKARSAPSPYVLARYNRWYVYLALVGLSIFVLSPLQTRVVRGAFIQAFRVPSGSMQPTELIGDLIFVDKTRGARARVTRGSVVMFYSLEQKNLLVVKRVVALPGDTIGMSGDTLFLNGHPVDEPYVQLAHAVKHEDPVYRSKMKEWQRRYYIGPSPESYAPDLQAWGPLVVPPDSVFVLGDNRDHSYDGRYWGFVPSADIVGQPLIVYWSYDAEAPTPLPPLTAVRWGRVGLRL